MTRQQDEALDYFRCNADRWKELALGACEDRVNITRQRNDFVLDMLARQSHLRSLLDIGCGSGELVAAAAERGLRSVGVDFSMEMIENAKSLDASNCEFICSSIFDCSFGAGQFDAIAANGLIEYISAPQLDDLLVLCRNWLKPGGMLVLGSRNRLFNLLSLNDFTLLESASGSLPALAAEAAALTQSPGMAEYLASVPALAAPPPQDFDHPGTGIAVARRYQYTPAELTHILDRWGFTVFNLAPAHIHAVPPAFKAAHPGLHTALSLLLQKEGGDSLALIPHASTFMAAAESRP